jgi:hypothetical protein
MLLKYTKMLKYVLKYALKLFLFFVKNVKKLQIYKGTTYACLNLHCWGGQLYNLNVLLTTAIYNL